MSACSARERLLWLTGRAPGPPVENVARAIGAAEWRPQAEMPRTTDASYVTGEAYAKAQKKYRKEFSKMNRTRNTDK